MPANSAMKSARFSLLFGAATVANRESAVSDRNRIGLKSWRQRARFAQSMDRLSMGTRSRAVSAKAGLASAAGRLRQRFDNYNDELDTFSFAMTEAP